MNAFTNKRRYAKKSLSLIEARTLYTNLCGFCKDDRGGGDVQWRVWQEARRQRQKKRTTNAG